MILHLVNNEKFIDSAWRVFERVAPGQHRWAVINQHPAATTYIQSFEPEILSVNQTIALLNDEQSGIEALAIHYLTREARRVLDALERDIPVLWIGYGGDYVHLLGNPKSIYLPNTAKLLQDINRPGGLWPALRSVLGRAHRLTRDAWPPAQAARILANRRSTTRIGACAPAEAALLKRVTYFAPVIREEHDAIAAQVPGFTAQFMHWNYTRIEKTYRLFDQGLKIEGDDIMLGNSAIPSNNHLDAFDALEPLVAQGRKLFCPLTYGHPGYADAVAAAGKARFGDAFVALRDYLPNARYVKTLSSCSIVVMPQCRQQARENILNMLYGGASVFMLDDNLLSVNLKRLGLPIRSMKHLSQIPPGPAVSSEAQIHDSRRILQNISGVERNNHQTRQVVDALLNR